MLNLEDKIIQLDIADIIPNRQQPRTIFDDEKIIELSESIKEHGVIQPIVVRQIESGYEIIAGERRFRASQKLNLKKIPAIIREYSDIHAASIAIIENIHREDLTPIEEAVAYQELMKLHGTTQSELATQVGKSQSTIANKIRLLNLSAASKQALLESKISERHARSLLIIKDEKVQEKILKKIIEKQLNVSQTEKLIEEYLLPKSKKNKSKTISKIPRNFKLAMNTFNQAAQMVERTGLNVETHTEEREDAFIITFSLKK